MQATPYQPINDSPCGWSRTTAAAPSYSRLAQDTHADWVIIGAGLTGLAAAYRLAELNPNDSIIMLDAEQAGAGASSRNSGYIVDISLNDGASSLGNDQAQMIKSGLNMAGLKQLKSQVEKYAIACDWDQCGKFHCAADARHIPKLKHFESFLDRAEVPNTVWQKDVLAQRLGTDYYQYAVQTHNGVLLNPAALVNGLLKNLPQSVRVYEHSPVMNIEQGKAVCLTTPQGSVTARKVIVAVNALMPRFGLKRNRVFPLTLTASLTRPLTKAEDQSIGRPAPWGVLSASAFGATVRLTNDRRILVRNTVEWWPAMTMNELALGRRRENNLSGLRRRFPALSELHFDYTWSGNVCISRNSKPVFEKTHDNVYLAGCYNAGGIAMGSLFGKLIVDYALGHDSEELTQVLAQEQPSKLPPRPIFDIGLQTRLAWQRYQGRNEA